MDATDDTATADAAETNIHDDAEAKEFKLHISRVPTSFDEDIVARILRDELKQEDAITEVVLIYPRDPSGDDDANKSNENEYSGNASSNDNSNHEHGGEHGDEKPTHRGFGFVTVSSQAVLDTLLRDHTTVRGGRKPASHKQHTMYLRPYQVIDKADETRQEVCYLWSEFRCPYGDACKFQHVGPGGVKLLGDKTATKKKKKCFQFKKTGKCSRGDDCPFSHDVATPKVDDAKSTTKRSNAEKDCISWKTKGKCKKKETCPYRHDEALRQKVLQKKAAKRKSQEATTQQQQEQHKERQPLSVRVFGMNYETTQQDIENYFQDCGKIVEITFPTFEDSQRSKGYCGVLFTSPKAVAKAIEMDGNEFMGRWLRIQAGKMYLKKWEEFHQTHQEQNRKRRMDSSYGDGRRYGNSLE